jgi:enoyl-CoA hydratase
MSQRVEYQLKDSVATISMDDGKANALSIQMLKELDGAIEQARSDRAVVVLSGREGMFSAGFDLRQLGGGGPDAAAMLTSGFELAEKILSLPTPVVIACSGHAIAMGVFLLLSGDYRVGVEGPYQIRANEVAIGLTMPRAAVEICRQRLSPAHFNRAVILAETYSPNDAVAAGFLDRTVQAGELQDVVQSCAAQLATLNMDAHAATKLRLRAGALEALRAAIEADAADFRALASSPATTS